MLNHNNHFHVQGARPTAVFRIISSKGVASPSNISTMRCALSSVTADSIGLDPTMTIMPNRSMMPNGTANSAHTFVDGVGEPAAGFVEAAGVAVGRDRAGLGILVVCRLQGCLRGGIEDGGTDFDECKELLVAHAFGQCQALKLGVGGGRQGFEDVARLYLAMGGLIEQILRAHLMGGLNHGGGHHSSAIDNDDAPLLDIRLALHERYAQKAAAKQKRNHHQSDDERLGADGGQVVALGDQQNPMQLAPPLPPGRQCARRCRAAMVSLWRSWSPGCGR